MRTRSLLRNAAILLPLLFMAPPIAGCCGGGAVGRSCALNATVRVVDSSTGAAISEVSLILDGVARTAGDCAPVDNNDGGSASTSDGGSVAPCTPQLFIDSGHHQLGISAPGYQAQTVALEVAPGPSVCGTGESCPQLVSKTVQLARM